MIIKHHQVDEYTYDLLSLSDYRWRTARNGTVLYKTDYEGHLTDMVSLKAEGYGYDEIIPIYTNPVLSADNYPLFPTEKAEANERKSVGISLASLLGGL